MEFQDQEKLAYKKIVLMVSFFWTSHRGCCIGLEKNLKEKINFKNKLVSDIEIDGEIYKHIIEQLRYIEQFSFIVRPIKVPFFASRVKNKASLDSKIERYKGEERYQFGKIPINKCLNDIFGARIIIDYPLSASEINDYLKDRFPKYNDLKIIDSSKNEYKATHIYFKCNNFCLPWELQIWYSGDEMSNRDSHKKYKQGYIRWEQSLREEE